MGMNSLASLLALTGAGVTGYLRGREQRAGFEAQEEDRAHRRAVRMRDVAQWGREDALRDEVTAASKPVAPQDASTYQPSVDDEGNAMPDNPTAGRRSVLGKVYDTPEAAGSAAEAANTPRATMGRVAGVYAKHGQVEKAGQLRAAIRAEDTAEQAQADQEFERGLRGSLASPDALADFMSQSHGDGMGGQVKFRAVPAQDGKSWRMHRVKPDGTMEPFGPQLTPDEQGMAVAGYMLSKSITPQQRMEHYRNLAKDKVDADFKDRQAATAEKNADTNEKWRANLADAANRKADAAVAKGAYERMDEADKLAYQSLNRQIETISTEIIKAQAQGMGDPAAIAKLRAQQTALQLQARSLLTKYQASAAPAPDPLGLRDSEPGAPLPTRVDPQEQAARDKDRANILQQELVKARQQAAIATDPAARSRAVSDVAALEREIELARRHQVSTKKSTRMTDVATALPRIPLGTAVPEVRPIDRVMPPPGPDPDPAEVAGANLDDARARLATAQQVLRQFGSRQKALRPDDFRAAQAELQAAERAEREALEAYSRHVPQQKAARGAYPRP